eukprot:4006343-Pleurochrysis_carterae.AAC.2
MGGLLDRSQVGELDDCAGRNNDGIALASGDDGRDVLLSGLDHHIGLGGHAKREPAHVGKHMLVTLGPGFPQDDGHVVRWQGAGRRCSSSRP